MNPKLYQLLRLTLVTLLLMPSSFAHAKTILVFGDSFSTGFGLEPEYSWVDMLRENVAEQHTVINASQRGRYLSNSGGRLYEALSEHQADIVIIALGINDGNREIRLDKIKRALSFMISTIKNHDADAAVFSASLPFKNGSIYAWEYENLFFETTERLDVPYLSIVDQDFFSNKLNLQADKWHPNITGQHKIYDRAKNFLTNKFGVEISDR